MTMISPRFIDGASGGKGWAAVVPVSVPSSFMPSIDTGQRLNAYINEEMTPYTIQGKNITPNLEEVIQLITDNNNNSYFMRA